MSFSKNYNFQVLYYVGATTITSACTSIAIVLHWGIVPIVLLLLLLILSIVKLCRFIQQINEQVFYFVKAVENNDTSILFPSKVGNPTVDKLYEALNRLNKHLNRVKVDSQLQEKYFEHILSQVEVGVILFSKKGIVRQTNTAALRLFQIPVLTHLHQLDKVYNELSTQLLLLPESSKQLLSITIKEVSVQIVLQKTPILISNTPFYLLTLQDIRGELERKEIEAWVKLIRVLNHEITNSLTPVTSLSESLYTSWKQNQEKPDQPLIETTIKGLNVIEERSRSLISFVNSYRMLTKIPKLQPHEIAIEDFMSRISILASPYRSSTVSITVEPPTSTFKFVADESMLVQVMLNLIKNGIEAIGSKGGAIKINAYPQNGKVAITVEDNGTGIPQGIADEIFTPFFTTKDFGSGIGLSYSKQIIRAHKGSLNFTSTPGNTRFTVEI